MRQTVKHFIENILIFCTRILLKKYKPKIIAVTGSSGKTTTKYIIGAVLVHAFGSKKVRIGYGNLGTKIGIPLAIAGINITFIDLPNIIIPFAWAVATILALLKTIWLYIIPIFPQYIVLEVAADLPGDIPDSARYLKPDVAIITNISPVHLVHFGTLDKLIAEKRALAEHVSTDGLVILNANDTHVTAMAGYVKAHIELLSVSSTQFAREAAYLVAKRYGVARDIVDHALETMVVPKGRFDVLQGKNDSILIDSTYNASPASMRFAFDKVNEMNPTGRKIFILGDMFELGTETNTAHEEIGQIARAQSDYLITVGEASKVIPADFWTMSPNEAAHHALNLLRPGDTILVKASHGMHLQKVVKMLER